MEGKQRHDEEDTDPAKEYRDDALITDWVAPVEQETAIVGRLP